MEIIFKIIFSIDIHVKFIERRIRDVSDFFAQVLVFLTVNGIVGTVLSDLLWARAVNVYLVDS